MNAKALVTAVCVGVSLLFASYSVGSVNPLAEDSNGNAVPDVVELQHGAFYIPPILGVSATVAVALVTIVVFTVYRRHIISKSREHRNLTDVLIKIYRSKYREVVGMRLWVLAVLCLVLGGLTLVSAQKTTNNPLSEDKDGDGLPTVAEMQIGTDPNDPYDYVALPSLNITVVEPAPLNVTIGR